MKHLEEILGKHSYLLEHKCTTIDKKKLYLPGKNFIDKVLIESDRSPAVLRSLSYMFKNGRLSGTGYINILPVDQGIEHSAGASFAINPNYFDPKNIIELAIEGGCNAVVSTYGVLGAIARKYAHKIPLILKINHNEMLSHPNIYDQTPFTTAKRAFEIGCIGIGATIYWGSKNCRRQILEVSKAFSSAHEFGLFTILWCYLRNDYFKKNNIDYHFSSDLTGQANHLGVTIEADLIKQKLPKNNNGYRMLNFGKTSDLVYSKLSSNNPIDLCRYQLANCYMGRVGLISSGGASGSSDIKQAIITAIINKRAGGSGVISGRKAFQKPLKEGILLLNTIQDIYLDNKITIA